MKLKTNPADGKLGYTISPSERNAIARTADVLEQLAYHFRNQFGEGDNDYEHAADTCRGVLAETDDQGCDPPTGTKSAGTHFAKPPAA